MGIDSLCLRKGLEAEALLSVESERAAFEAESYLRAVDYGLIGKTLTDRKIYSYAGIFLLSACVLMRKYLF